jgi:hypothetical protein
MNHTENHLDNPTPPKKEGFWKRQFSPTVTRRQRIFDMIVGAIIPILLLIFDPVVFRSQGCIGYGGPALANVAIFSYLGVGIGIAALLIWLFVPNLPPVLTAFIAGILAIGGVFAAVVGIALLPYSAPGLALFCIGLLGFIPFLISIVYARNAVRAMRIITRVPNKEFALVGAMIAGAIFVVIVPMFIQGQIVRAVDNAFQRMIDNPTQIEAGAQDLVAIKKICLGLCNATIDHEYVQITAKYSKARRAIEDIYFAKTDERFPAPCNTSD